MAISSGNKEGGLFTEINITPLTDIFLVLLIIMMVMAPMFQSVDQDIKVPEINSGLNVESKNATVSVTKDAKFYLNGEKINPENLAEELKLIIDKVEEKNVVVKADEKTKNSEIMKIIRAAQEANYEKLTVAGEPLSKKQQQDLKDNASDTKDNEKTSE